jgi:hypothetical protein
MVYTPSPKPFVFKLWGYKFLVSVAFLMGALLIAFLYWPRPTQLPKQCTFATRGWMQPSDGRSVFRPLVVVQVLKGSIMWNGTAVDRTKLAVLASQSSAMNPAPFIVFEPQPNSNDCETEQEVQKQINKTALCEASKLCGLGTREEWKVAPPIKMKNTIE